ncbi:MAG: S8 family serine peptidase, partial [Chloroflexi bacterium]|nr:S8 family serine peptidase [Chloroflexota bacterium]
MSAAVVALAVLASLAMVDSVQSQPAPTDDPAQKVIDLQRAKRAADVSPDRLIIVYDAAGTADSVARARLRQSVRAQLLRSDHGGSREVVRVLSANAAAVAAQLKQSPLVVDAYPDHVVSLTLTPDDPLFPQQWDLPKISAPTAWDTTEGNNAAVAVLDCGVHSNHPDLNGQVVLESNFSAAGTTDDLCNHGTHVAGTIAAIIDNGVGVAGVAPRAHLLNGKVLDDTGSGFLSDVESGIEWAADNGANVVNMSLGAPIACDTGMQQAVNYAWNKGVVVVAAAGNSGTSGAASPGSCNNVIAVAATDSNDAKPNWSNFGANVSLAAPGVNIVSTVNPADNGGNLYASLSGTSMAAPHVSALAALVWSSTYGSSASAVRDRMFSTADKISGTGSLWTYGRIDAAAAVAPATPTGAPAPAAVVQPLAAPVRIADTRSSGGPIASGSQRCFAIAGQAGIPVDAAGVVLNVTAIGYSSQGWITIYPAGQVAPTTSTLNFDPAVYAVANGSIIPLSNGQVCAAVGTVIPGAGSAHVLLDVTAYIPSASAAAMPLLSTPQRVADTRANGGAPVPTGSGRCFTVTGTPGIGSDAGAVLLNVTAVGYGTRGW